MSTQNINIDIENWISELPDWVKFAIKHFYQARELTDEAIKEIYERFHKDEDLKTRSASENIDINIEKVNNQNNNLTLLEISNIQNINALTNNQKIEFSPNLTVIYGANGSGKTGYIRLLNNIFDSKGDKEILPDIHKDNQNTEPLCNLIFQSNSKPQQYKLIYPQDKGCEEFKQFAVFDNKCVNIHLDGKNGFYTITPKSFEIFEWIVNLYTKIKEMLNKDIEDNSPDNIFKGHFQEDTEIKIFIDTLNDSSDLGVLKKYSDFSESDKKELDNLKKQKSNLETANTEKKINDLNDLLHHFNDLKNKISRLLEILSDDTLQTIKNDISMYNKKQDLSKQSGTDQFKYLNIKEIGSPEWKEFIEKAFNFAKLQHSNEVDDVSYPKENDHCLLCNQTLSDGAKDLISNYWEFLKSTIEKETKQALNKINQYINIYKSNDFNLLQDDSVLVQWLNDKDEKIIKSWKEKISALKNPCQSILENLNNKSWDEESLVVDFNLDDIDSHIQNVRSKIDELNNQNTSEQIEKINKQLSFLNHKNLLSKKGTLFKPILEYILKHQDAKRKKDKESKLATRTITAKQKELYNKYITENYIKTFNKECENLNAQLGIEIKPTGRSGQTLKELLIKDFKPSQILSEGEQRAVSLADFLTEIQGSDINRGIIFDDPVNSLDNDRKETIAKRLAQESNKRQVIVFTHNLAFLYHLVNCSSDSKINYRIHWIEKRNSTPGYIFLDNSPANGKDYKKATKANDFYEKSKNTPPEEKEDLLKSGFGALRTSYEALFIYTLLGGALERFNERISIGCLKDSVLPKEFVKHLIEKQGIISKYIEGHSHSDNYCANKPTPEILKHEIDEFLEFKKQINEYKKEMKSHFL